MQSERREVRELRGSWQSQRADRSWVTSVDQQSLQIVMLVVGRKGGRVLAYPSHLLKRILHPNPAHPCFSRSSSMLARSRNWLVHVSHVLRSGNMIADSLAKSALVGSIEAVYLDEASSCVQDLLFAESGYS
ncbi:hypothetical protein V6N13_132882 [Hibiscus sabdariffa]